jgi:hypothetical protein
MHRAACAWSATLEAIAVSVRTNPVVMRRVPDALQDAELGSSWPNTGAGRSQARRYLTEGCPIVIQVDGDSISAERRSGARGGLWCLCAARGQCRHPAARLVTAVRRAAGPPLRHDADSDRRAK